MVKNNHGAANDGPASTKECGFFFVEIVLQEGSTHLLQAKPSEPRVRERRTADKKVPSCPRFQEFGIKEMENLGKLQAAGLG